MKPADLFLSLLATVMIAAGVALFLVPKLDEAQSAEEASVSVTTTPDLSVANVSPTDTELRRSAVLTRRNDGHYWGRALVNNKATVEFMVDTGASVVALNYRDAQKMGLKPDTLDYTWTIRTAGGDTLGASVLIDSIKINQVHVKNVEAMVLKTDLEQSLLGMSFLSQLYSYEFRGERMIIRQ